MEKYIISEAFDKLSDKKLNEVKGLKSDSKYVLKVAGKKFPQLHATSGIENAFINTNGYEIKKIIRKLDDDNSDDYFDYNWEYNDEIDNDYSLWVNRYYEKEASGTNEVFEIDDRRIKDVNDLYKYIDYACKLVNDENADYIEVVTPKGNVLVSYEIIRNPIELSDEDIQYTDVDFRDYY